MFVWSHEDMLGIDLGIIVHHLNANPNIKPVKLKRRSYNQDRYEDIKQEVDMLLKAGYIIEVYYPKLIGNVVMAKKANGQCHICVDFTNLNKACFKITSPCPRLINLWTPLLETRLLIHG